MEVIVEAIGNRLRGWLDAMLLFRRKRLRRSTSRGRWTLARYRAEGVAGLRDRSCAAHRRPHALTAPWRALIKLLRLGLGRLRDLNPSPPVQRYEWSRPGELVHLDIKKLGRIVRPSHRVTGNRRDTVDGADWEYAHVAIDDCLRFAYVEILPDEKRYTATRFWLRALREFRRHGIKVRRVLTDNGSAYRSRAFRKACRRLGIVAKRTQPYHPQTNVKRSA